MPIIILKDDDRNPVTDPLTGRPVQVEVSEEIAAFLARHDSYTKWQENMDDRDFGLLHFEDQAWSNLRELSTGYSAEDQSLDVLAEIAAAERTHYIIRLTRCRQAYQLLKDACTPTQWRRFLLNRYYGKTTREIAAMEGCHRMAVWKSVNGAQKKINKILKNFRFKP